MCLVTFVQIAHATCQPEVLRFVGTSKNARDDVLDFKRCRDEFLRRLAVAATVTSLLSDTSCDSG